MNYRYLFVLSVAANAALVAYLCLRPNLSEKALSSGIHQARLPAPESQGEPAKSSPDKTLPNQTQWARIYSNDLPTFIANLRAFGLPPRLLRAIVASELEAADKQKLIALGAKRAEAPFWRNQTWANWHFNWGYTAIMREEAKTLEQLLGEDALPPEDEVSYRSSFAALGLGPKKTATLERLVGDYGELEAKIADSFSGLSLEESSDKVRLMREEMRRDLAGLLTPEELRAYDLRYSETANVLRHRFGAFDFSQAEFEALFDAQTAAEGKDLGVALSLYGGERTNQATLAQLKVAFGEARYKELQMSESSEYKTAYAVAERNGLPKDNVVAVYNLEKESKSRMRSIMVDTALSKSQVASALRQLSNDYNTKLNQLLSEKGASSYKRSASGALSSQLESIVKAASKTQGASKP